MGQLKWQPFGEIFNFERLIRPRADEPFGKKLADAILTLMTNKPQLSLEDISRLGEKFYTEELKEKLEKEHMGKYAVIDVEKGKYYIDADRLTAVEKAGKESGDTLFYIIQIGNVQHPSMNFNAKKYAWNF